MIKESTLSSNMAGLFVLLFCSTAAAQSAPAPIPDEEPGWFERNMRLAIDLSSRTVINSAWSGAGYQHAIGIDFHKVVSTQDRDVGTLLLQGYLTRIDEMEAHPGFFEDESDTQFVYRIFNFNYTGLPGHAPNIRVGHFEIPFGLEHTINTNGTLRQYQVPRNLGVKADWGVGVNKQHRHFEYEVGLSSGGGQSIERNNESFVFSSRLGTRRDENHSFGLSLYRARLGGSIRERYGADARMFFGRNASFLELSLGNNAGQNVVNGQVEFNRVSRTESLLYYVQGAFFSQDSDAVGWDSATQGIVGLRVAAGQYWLIDAQYSRDLSVFGNAEKHDSFALQARFRM